MKYKYTGTIELSDLEDNSIIVPFEFTHTDQMVHTHVKHHALELIFNNNLISSLYCRIGCMDYSMEMIV